MSDIKKDVTGNETNPAERIGGEAVVETLKASGVDMIFGYSGGGTGPVINAVAKSGLANMNGRTELAGAWMSYGYNRVKGRAASACVFYAVGTLHCSPAIYGSKLDSTPLLILDVNLDNSLDFREGLQDGTQVHSAIKPIAKSATKAVMADDLPLAVRQALLSANTGRPGPSVIDMSQQAVDGLTSTPVEPLVLPEPPAATEATIKRVLEMISKAERPVLFVGAGVQLGQATSELEAIVEKLQIPVVSTSWGGRGAMPDDHPLFAGLAGSFGWNSANEIVQKSDLWIALGTTFSQMTTGAWNIVRPNNVIQVDIDPNQLGKIFQPTLGITAHTKVFLQQMIDQVEKENIIARDASADLSEIAELKQEWFEYRKEVSRDTGKENAINQYYLIDKMSESLPSGTIMVGDSGGGAFMAYRAFSYKEITPMPLGSRYMSLGAGLSVAIGAKLAAPERTVVCYHGDGGFYYNAMELSTLAEKKIKIILVIDNNRCLLANRSGMKLLGQDNPWVDCAENTDFVSLAKAQGLEGEKVTKAEDITAALQRAIESEGSYVLDFWTDPNTLIGRSLRDVIPIFSDRKPSQTAAGHQSPHLDGCWPA